MEKELLAFATGFFISQGLTAIRISRLKSKIKVYELYVRQRLDQTVELVRSGLNSR